MSEYDPATVRCGDLHSEVVDFLRRPAAYGQSLEPVSVIETHAALVFLSGHDVYKIKKPVKYSYLDFSTLPQREAACRNELAVNQPHAGGIYLGVVAITRQENGALEIGGSGPPVEWAVHMRRFPDDAVLEAAIDRRELTPDFIHRLTDEIVRYHSMSSRKMSADGAGRMTAVLDELSEAFAAAPTVIRPRDLQRFSDRAATQLGSVGSCLNERSQQGSVRRCHGDLHLGNIVDLDGTPVLFDAIEFNDEIATIDLLYDLAFLLMDLGQRGMDRAANQILNRYLDKCDDPNVIGGLAAMPLFLACRAGIRAMVAISQMHQCPERMRENKRKQAVSYFRAALEYLNPKPARLIAIGGFSGTGKTTLARSVAAEIAPCFGAVHFRSDIERKKYFGVAETTKLGENCYTSKVSNEIYALVLEKAARALKAGASVVVDAAFLSPHERADIAALAQTQQVQFTGIWLSADEQILMDRVQARRNDASDANQDVVRRQLAAGAGDIDWDLIDAAHGPSETLSQALQILKP